MQKMTTTPPTTGRGAIPTRTVPTIPTQMPKQMQSWKQTKRRGRRGNREKRKERRKKKNNNNYMKLDGLINEGIMKEVTISPGSSATMASDYRNFKKSAAAYAAAKGYTYWPGVIGIMEPVADTEWKTKRSDKKEYAVIRTTTLKKRG